MPIYTRVYVCMYIKKIYIYNVWLYIYIRGRLIFHFFLNIKKNNALKVVYIPIKYSYQKIRSESSTVFC